MEIIKFNNDWYTYRLGEKDLRKKVDLPHDAMIHENRSFLNKGGANTGFFDAYDYVYEKSFDFDGSFQGKNVYLEFEGVYRNAEIYFNDEKIYYRPYGYTNFYINIDKFIQYNQPNLIKVIARNAEQPSSRWYTGAGIYREVNLIVFPQKHIVLNSVKITTVDYLLRRIKVEASTSHKGEIKLEIIDKDEVIFSQTSYCDHTAIFEFNLDQAILWDEFNPYLYDCRITFEGDIQMHRFGIRTVSINVDTGLTVNGVNVLLKGACIHHDNGLLGAAAYSYAEKRKVRIIKEAGYNAIRSAHNPCSKALLNACDELGIYVMDEYVDMWYIQKIKYDYVKDFSNWWKQDLLDMIEKDFNHPSVIMYSLGNEVAETSEKRGIKLVEDMTNFIHAIDHTRYVTCGINIFFNLLYSLGFGVYSDNKAEKQQSVGSEFFNQLAGIFGDTTMKFGATLPGCDAKTKDAFSKLDISGYNYGIMRYKRDLRKYKRRIIVGSETFCSDAYKFIKFAKSNPRLIGDFVWAGMDYLGEVGIGAWEYKDYAKSFSKEVGWISSGSGRIDLTGKHLGEMLFTRVAFGLDPIRMAVIPVNNFGKKHSPSAWKLTNARENWAWDENIGKKTTVEVYSTAHHIRLFINDQLIKQKKMRNKARVMIKVKYQPGILKAVAYDIDNHEIGHTILISAKKETKLTMQAENTTVNSINDLIYVRLQFTDNHNIVKPLIIGDIEVQVKNGELLALGNACPYNETLYFTGKTSTYFGEALAIIKPMTYNQNVEINAISEYGMAHLEILVNR